MKHFRRIDASIKKRLRPNTNGRTHVAMSSMKESVELEIRHPLNMLATAQHACEAIYEMKGKPFIQEHKQDDSTLQLLGGIPYAYQIDMIVYRYKSGGFTYPTPDVIKTIIQGLYDENVFGRC